MAPEMVPERELFEPVSLCGADGRFNPKATGWSRHPLHTCNLPPGLPRKKKWNYWAVTNDDLLFSATIADMERLQMGSSYLFDRRTHSFHEKTVTVPAETIAIPETVMGSMVIEHRDLSMALMDEGSGTRIRVRSSDFGGASLDVDILVERPAGHETLNVVVPWSDLQTQFTSKQNTLPASGHVSVGGERFELRQPAFGCLDYGRGVWPEQTTWNWGSASGIQAGHTLRLNLGGRWTDGTGMTENGICLDGRLTKLSEDLAIEYDRAKWMAPWRVRTTITDCVDLVFQPEFERAGTSGRRDAFYTEVHQMFGTYSGRVGIDDGTEIAVQDLFGWIEEHEARW